MQTNPSALLELSVNPQIMALERPQSTDPVPRCCALKLVLPGIAQDCVLLRKLVTHCHCIALPLALVV